VALPLHKLPTRVGRSFLVEHRGVLTLVDAGTRNEPEKIAKAIRALGRDPRDVAQIVISHGHGDHAGGASRMRQLCEAPVYCGAGDADVIAGKRPYDSARAAWARAMYGWLARYPRFEVDHPVSERTEIEGGLEIVPAPGHTKGHVAVWAPDHQALFVGDAVWRLPRLSPSWVSESWKAFTQDRERNTETVRRLADLPAQALFFGHGNTIRKGGRDSLRRLTDR
jgi:glyoxylase-like metal-dependent hydrolase (beta-lactamase superfamily II)